MTALAGDVASDWDADMVLPGLWVGSAAAAECEEQLLAHGVVRVVAMAPGRLRPELTWSSVAKAQIKVKTVEIEDHPSADILRALPRAIRNIDKTIAGRKSNGTTEAVLVADATGNSLAVTAISAWIIMRKKRPCFEALLNVQACRPTANPNFGFVQALSLLDDHGGNLESAQKSYHPPVDDRLRRKISVGSDRSARSAQS
jgi:hypothetical protein